MSQPRVCFFGAYDPEYPRNLILRRGLMLHGAQVVECRVSPKLNTVQRAQALERQFPALADQCDVILLAEFNQSLAGTAKKLARKYHKRLAVDAFTSLYDSAVYDRAVARPVSLAALRYRWIDWTALRLADLVLADTARNRGYFVKAFRADPSRIHIIPVGASREWFETPIPSHTQEDLLVLFYGTYIPLHGVETILRAASLLRDREAIRFEIIGRGQTYAAMQRLARDLDLPNTTFLDPVPPRDLPALAARADIALGIFGTTPKAARVVPNKVYQMLALGRPLISADTPALRDAFATGVHLLAVPPGDPESLAASIAALADDPDRRAALAAAGRACVAAEFDESALGRRLLDVLA